MHLDNVVKWSLLAAATHACHKVQPGGLAKQLTCTIGVLVLVPVPVPVPALALVLALAPARALALVLALVACA